MKQTIRQLLIKISKFKTAELRCLLKEAQAELADVEALSKPLSRQQENFCGERLVLILAIDDELAERNKKDKII